MIERVYDEIKANECDKLLTLLIHDEKQYNQYIDDNFVVKDFYKNTIKDKNNILLSYIDNEKIVGFVYLKPTCDEDKKGYLIDALFVLKEYRKKGIAKKLLNEAISIVKESDFIDINVMYNNKIAYNLYKSLGFNEIKIMLRK